MTTSVTDPKKCTPESLARRSLRLAEVLVLLVFPLVMGCAALFWHVPPALLMLAGVVLSLGLFFAGIEVSQLRLRQIMPTLVLAAVAACGRVLFAAFPDVKPVSAIAIIAGAALGRRCGFMTGALAALASNVFFGQGMWTPWQMYAWGLVGYGGGVLAELGCFTRATGTPRRWAVLGYGLASGLMYGVVINAYDVIGFVRPLTWQAAVARVSAAVPFDVIHSLATCAFLAVLYVPWMRRIGRVVRRYGL